MADDLTGSVDLATGLAAVGLRVVIVTSGGAPEGEFHAVVVALKSRNAPPHQAVELTLSAARDLLGLGVETLYLKYCSTFDSTERGNIGPVADALLELTGAPLAVVAPGYPANGRTVYRGHLFVGDALLSESDMRDHPLTPMTDSSLVRLMSAQSAHHVGSVVLDDLRAGRAVLRFDELVGQGARYAVVDTVDDGDLETVAEACADHPLVTGGAALAQALGARRGHPADPSGWRPPPGRGGVLSGSCSAATRRQVAGEAARWALGLPADQRFLVSSTAEPHELAAIHAALGADTAAAIVEDVLARVAKRLVDEGVTRLVVAGGETSGAVVAALGVRTLHVRTPIGPGLAWCESDQGVALALKSGNFGGDGVFGEALELLDEESR